MRYDFLHEPLRCIVLQECVSGHYFATPKGAVRHLKRTLVPADFRDGTRLAIVHLLASGLEGDKPPPLFAESHLEAERPSWVEFWKRASPTVEPAGKLAVVNEDLFRERREEFEKIGDDYRLVVTPSPHIGRLVAPRARAWERQLWRNLRVEELGWEGTQRVVNDMGSDPGCSCLIGMPSGFGPGSYHDLRAQLHRQYPELVGAKPVRDRSFI
jgi:sugar phosphate isomerase/epimerase